VVVAFQAKCSIERIRLLGPLAFIILWHVFVFIGSEFEITRDMWERSRRLHSMAPTSLIRLRDHPWNIYEFETSK
jgi:hypothetical protein